MCVGVALHKVVLRHVCVMHVLFLATFVSWHVLVTVLILAQSIYLALCYFCAACFPVLCVSACEYVRPLQAEDASVRDKPVTSMRETTNNLCLGHLSGKQGQVDLCFQ